MDVNASTISDIMQKIEDNSDTVTEAIDNIVSSYTSSLDDLMKSIADDLVYTDDVPTAIIERYFLELSSAIYFVSGKAEHLGVYDGVSKAQLEEKYNNLYLLNKADPLSGKNRTAAELNAMATEGSKYESVVSDLYTRAYRMVKYKIEAANTLNSTLSKVLSHKMQQEQALSTDVSSKRILTE